MNLNTYLLALMKDSTAPYTPNTLEIPKTLCDNFRNMMRRSDAEVIEYGRSLYWKLGNGGPRVKVGDTLYSGAGTAVSLDTTNERAKFEYIGDFHTHPYAEKYGPLASVGPSNGDWTSWWHLPPTKKPVAIYFVASGSKLYAIVFRNIPTTALNETNVPGDAGRINQLVQNMDIRVADTYGTALQRKNWPGLRTFLAENAPDLPDFHEEDTNNMNKGLCNINGCEYFVGSLDSASASLKLLSDRVLGNWLTVNLWKTSKEPWFKAPF